MRLHPGVSPEEALGWLTKQAQETFGVDASPELQAALEPFAEAMAAVGAVQLPDEIEPAFP